MPDLIAAGMFFSITVYGLIYIIVWGVTFFFRNF